MARTRRKAARKRVGQVSYYEHHGGWWLYYREGTQRRRLRVADCEADAAALAAQVNGQLAERRPTWFSFAPISVADLQHRFIDEHEHVRRSSLATVSRYRTATLHLVNFYPGVHPAHEVDITAFVRYLRELRVAPNGHRNARKRPLRDKGINFILQTCGAMYAYAAKKRHLPPYAENPFAGLGGRRAPIDDAKPIFVFDAQTELQFLQQAQPHEFAENFLMAKTGMRPAEVTHLLIEELDLANGWLSIRNKPELGWKIKSRKERSIPLIDELVRVLSVVVGERRAGAVFLRAKLAAASAPLRGFSRQELARESERRVEIVRRESATALTRVQIARIYKGIWRDAGAKSVNTLRNTFIGIAGRAQLPQAACPKSWRHTFATLLQDAGVDPLIRQLTLGHAPTFGAEGALGMTTTYTHTRPGTHRREIIRAVQLWPATLSLAATKLQGGKNHVSDSSTRFS